jgi:hypothetical protein
VEGLHLRWAAFAATTTKDFEMLEPDRRQDKYQEHPDKTEKFD